MSTPEPVTPYDDLLNRIAAALRSRWGTDPKTLREAAGAILAAIPGLVDASNARKVWLPVWFVSGETTDFTGFGVEPLAPEQREQYHRWLVIPADQRTPRGVADSA